MLGQLSRLIQEALFLPAKLKVAGREKLVAPACSKHPSFLWWQVRFLLLAWLQRELSSTCSHPLWFPKVGLWPFLPQTSLISVWAHSQSGSGRGVGSLLPISGSANMDDLLCILGLSSLFLQGPVICSVILVRELRHTCFGIKRTLSWKFR